MRVTSRVANKVSRCLLQISGGCAGTVLTACKELFETVSYAGMDVVVSEGKECRKKNNGQL